MSQETPGAPGAGFNGEGRAAGDATRAGVDRAPFGTTPAGEAVEIFTIRNGTGVELRAVGLGGIVTSLAAPDREGEPADVVLGHETLEAYLANTAYFGAIVGRYANRIAGGRFTLDGETYALATNDGPNHLHGGARGFDAVVWNAEPFEREAQRGLILRRVSPAGEEGYPGTLEVTVTYTLTDRSELVVDYRAVADAATPVNLTHHDYFNLGGAGRGDILDHELTIEADAFLPVDPQMIPTGEVRPVHGTPFDFRTPTPVGARIGADDRQLRRGRGYDHTFVLGRPGGDVRPAARVTHPASGRVLTVHTTEPGLQLYTGNALDGTITGKGGRSYGRHGALCLETQHFPDSPNRPAFPSTILRPGEVYRSRTVMAFGVVS